MTVRLRRSAHKRSPSKEAGFYCDQPPRKPSLSSSSSTRHPKRRRVNTSEKHHHDAPSPQMQTGTLHLRVALAPPSSHSAPPGPEASSSSSGTRDASVVDNGRGLFRSLAVKHAKYHRTPSEYRDSKHRAVYGHPDDVKNAMCEYRIKLVEALGIREGDKVLEIGCGHGYTTIALAEAVGPDGFVMATDTADENYGSPLTLEENQTFIHLKAPASLVERFQFKMQTTVDELFKDYPEYEGYFNKIVLAHSLFYFASVQEIRETFRLLWDKATPDAELCIAEWGMAESRKAAAAHRAAVNTQATLESFRKVLKAPAINNVRTALTPGVMKELAQMEGWSNPNPKDKVAGGQAVEGFFAPRPEVPEAKWEVGMVCSQKFDQDVKRVCMALPSPLSPEEAYYQIATQWEQMQLAIDDHGSDDLEGVLCMDVWHARLPRQATRFKATPNDFTRHPTIRSRSR